MYTIPPETIYDTLFAPAVGQVPQDSSKYQFFGLDKYLAEHGTNILKTLSIMYLTIPFLIILIGILACLERCINRLPRFCRGPLNAMKKKVMFNSILRLTIESYMPIAFATGVGMLNLRAGKTIDKINAILTIFWAVYLIFLPNYYYKFLRTFRPTLHKPEIKAQYSSIYLNVDYLSLPALSLNLL